MNHSDSCLQKSSLTWHTAGFCVHMRLHLIGGCWVKKQLGSSLLLLSVSLRLEVIKKTHMASTTAPEVSQQLTPKDKICNWKMGLLHLFKRKKK